MSSSRPHCQKIQHNFRQMMQIQSLFHAAHHTMKEFGDISHIRTLQKEYESALTVLHEQLFPFESNDPEIPRELTIGGRIYGIRSFLHKNELEIEDVRMSARSKYLNAIAGEEDGRFFLDHQDEIPAILRRKVAFVFAQWRPPIFVAPGIAVIVWSESDGVWRQHWNDTHSWDDSCRLVRCRS